MKRRRQKTRDPIARALRTPKFRPRVIADKRRKEKHKKAFNKRVTEENKL